MDASLQVDGSVTNHELWMMRGGRELWDEWCDEWGECRSACSTIGIADTANVQGRVARRASRYVQNVNVFPSSRNSRITSASFDRNMYKLAPGSSTIFAFGTPASRSRCHFFTIAWRLT